MSGCNEQTGSRDVLPASGNCGSAIGPLGDPTNERSADYLPSHHILVCSRRGQVYALGGFGSREGGSWWGNKSRQTPPQSFHFFPPIREMCLLACESLSLYLPFSLCPKCASLVLFLFVYILSPVYSFACVVVAVVEAPREWCASLFSRPSFPLPHL